MMNTLINKLLLPFIFLLYTTGTVLADGIVRGKITDENGEPLIGAIVVSKDVPTLGTVTNFDGDYSIKIPSKSLQVLLIKYVGYQTIEESFTLTENEVVVKNYALIPDSKILEEVVVKAKAKRANETYMQLVKSKSAVSLDYISSETIKRTGDSYASDAIKRVTGVSTIGGFVSVRGLADRYIKTAVNGLRIPTLDPITNNIKLDIFPTSLVDNIIITKTSSPDLPGDWTGSYVSIETKDYPDKLTVGMSLTFGYNPQTTFQEVISSKRSPTDWLGYDNGFRDGYRAGYKGTYPIFYGNSKHPMLPYHEFTALGLGQFIKDNGLTEQTLGVDSRNNLDSYYRLCLVELGLLAPGLIDDMEAVQDAVERYDQEYKSQAFKMINTPVGEFGNTMSENWGTVKRKAPLNFSQEFSIGNQFDLFKKPFGFLFGLRYASSLKYDPGATANIAEAPEGTSDRYVTQSRDFMSSSQSNSWSALINIAYQYSPNHSISFMVMPILGGVNYVREGLGMNYTAPVDDALIYGISQYYEERKQLIYQVHSVNYFPKTKIKLDIAASYTDGESSIPDSKSLKLYPEADQYTYRSSDYEYKKSTYLFEDVYDANMFIELPVSNKPGLVRKIKFGGAYQVNLRESEIYRFYLSYYGNSSNLTLTNTSQINKVFSKENFAFDENGFYYYDYDYSPTNFVIGNSSIQAAYVMGDYAFNSILRVSGGLRLEYTDMETDVKLFHELNLPANHPDRNVATAGGGYNLPSAKPGELKRYNYLPSVNIIGNLISKERFKFVTRFNYSHTIARPSIREITPLYQEDFILQKDILGNPKLKIVEIDNYDFRMESNFANGDNLSVSLFYKNFTNHIELVEVPYTTWKNAEVAEAYGIELEGQKKITKNFDFRANITFIKSYAKIALEQQTITHPMFGQAPYIINAMLGYNSEKSRISGTLSYNVQGRKLALVTNRSSSKETSDIYEMPQHLLDLKLTKSFGKHFGMSFRVRNILNAPVRRSYDFKEVGLIDYDRYDYGSEYLLGLSYNL